MGVGSEEFHPEPEMVKTGTIEEEGIFEKGRERGRGQGDGCGEENDGTDSISHGNLRSGRRSRPVSP